MQLIISLGPDSIVHDAAGNKINSSRKQCATSVLVPSLSRSLTCNNSVWCVCVWVKARRNDWCTLRCFGADVDVDDDGFVYFPGCTRAYTNTLIDTRNALQVMHVSYRACFFSFCLSLSFRLRTRWRLHGELKWAGNMWKIAKFLPTKCVWKHVNFACN